MSQFCARNSKQSPPLPHDAKLWRTAATGQQQLDRVYFKKSDKKKNTYNHLNEIVCFMLYFIVFLF